MKKSAKVKNLISESEVSMAAKYFSICNLAVEQVFDRAHGNIDYAWSLAQDMVEGETGVSIMPEYRDWLKSIEKGSNYMNETWAKVRNQFVK